MQIFMYLILYVLSCSGLYGMFEKMGIFGWYAFVPVLNIYYLVKACWDPAWFWILMILCGCCLVLPYLYTAHGQPLTVTRIVMQMAAALVWLLVCLHVSASFHHGAFMGILFSIVPFVMGFVFSRGIFRGRTISLSNVNQETAKIVL